MIEQLQQIQDALKQVILTYIEAQKINIEPSFDTKVNAAETHIRVIANKRVPYLMFDIMKQINLLNAIEFEEPEASVQYLVQVVSSITNFTEIWERCLQAEGRQGAVQVNLQNLFELVDEIQENYKTLVAFKPTGRSHKSGLSAKAKQHR